MLKPCTAKRLAKNHQPNSLIYGAPGVIRTPGTRFRKRLTNRISLIFNGGKVIKPTNPCETSHPASSNRAHPRTCTAAWSRIFILVFISSIVGCGRPVDISYHYNTPADVLEQKNSGIPRTQGFAWRTWREDIKDVAEGHVAGHWDCDIWLIDKQFVKSESCWNELIEHEQRHCREGSFHPNTPEGGLISCD